MEPIEVFQILGIEQTKDERALKNAYRDKLTVTNPEDDPEGFKRLRMAYEEACRYAGMCTCTDSDLPVAGSLKVKVLSQPCIASSKLMVMPDSTS